MLRGCGIPLAMQKHVKIVFVLSAINFSHTAQNAKLIKTPYNPSDVYIIRTSFHLH